MNMLTMIKALQRISGILAIFLAVTSTPLHADYEEATITAPASSVTVVRNQVVNFTATSTDSVGNYDFIVNDISWTFGDGTSSSGASTSHAYATAGIYTVTLTVNYTTVRCTYTNADGECVKTSRQNRTDSATRIITVSSASVNPISPSNPMVNAGSSLPFSASVSGALNTGVSWSVSGGGSINGSGLFTATTAGTYTVTARSVDDSTKSTSTNVTVNSIVTGVNISSGVSLREGEGTTFTASAVGLGGNNPAVTWSTNGGTITSGGVYTAPIQGGSFTVTATSVQNTNQSATATVTVSTASVATPTAPATTVNTGGSIQFTSSVSGAVDAGITWSVTPGPGPVLGQGTISASGLFTGTASGTCTVTATSSLDHTKSSNTKVAVNPVVVSNPLPVNGVVDSGSTLQYSVNVSGAENPAVTWTVSGGGSIDPKGLFTATTAGQYQVTATSIADTSQHSFAWVTVKAVVSGMTLTAPKTALKAGEIIRLTASVSLQGGGSNAVTWSAVGGSIFQNGDGTFTAAIPPDVATAVVTATSVQNPSVVRSVTFTVSSAAVAALNPADPVVSAGSSVQFTSNITGAANTGITWTVSGGGCISSSGLFSATPSCNTKAGAYTVTATSQADPTKNSSTSVSVKAVVLSVDVSPSTCTLNPGDSQKFSAVVSGLGITNGGVTWTTSDGVIQPDGTFTAPNKVCHITVTATSMQDPTKTGTSSVRVKGWVLRWRKDIVYVGTKEVGEVDAQGMHVTLVDHLGSPRLLVGPTGNLEAEQKFLPFGEPLSDPTSAAKFAKGFTNHEQTDPSGLIYMQARFYAPWYGRFLSPDPARDQHFEETQSWNIYSYCQNDPTMKIDPNGMWEVGETPHAAPSTYAAQDKATAKLAGAIPGSGKKVEATRFAIQRAAKALGVKNLAPGAKGYLKSEQVKEALTGQSSVSVLIGHSGHNDFADGSGRQYGVASGNLLDNVRPLAEVPKEVDARLTIFGACDSKEIVETSGMKFNGVAVVSVGQIDLQSAANAVTVTANKLRSGDPMAAANAFIKTYNKINNNYLPGTFEILQGGAK